MFENVLGAATQMMEDIGARLYGFVFVLFHDHIYIEMSMFQNLSF